MLDWLFATSRFDALVVNYTWLSRAFLHAPRGVLKVLDTHDRFSGRKELLESQGVAPEFFYITEAEERVALERADIVWAIKGEERDFFAGLAARPTITVPHAEPMRPLPSRATAIRTVQEHLGHKSLSTTLGFYVDRRGTAATARYDALIESHLAGMKSRRSPNGGGRRITNSQKGDK
jgi:hypothetical protein